VDPVSVDPARERPGERAPRKVDANMARISDYPPSQPGTPRSQPRAPDSAHPSGTWFCPMPMCARREWASPTAWVCLQSLVSHHRSVRLSAGSAPPDSWLRAHNLRVCLACHELSALGSRCPGPRCSTAVLAALAAGNSAPTPGANPIPTVRDAPQGPGYPQFAGHADPHAAQGIHCGLLQLRSGPDVPAAGRGTRADV